MVFSINDEILTQKTILVAPLDWGLGHATRCIPIIKELQNYPVKIIIAGDGAVITLLKQEFPQLQFVSLPGYNIKYSKNRRWFLLKLLIQFPGVLFCFFREHRWLSNAIRELNLSAVISDNRFGLFHPSIASVYITHQLSVKTGNILSDKIATQIHRKCSKNYTQCWIPDIGIKKNLAGDLSRTVKLRQSDTYIGCLSRFEKGAPSEITVDLLIILSGPEPQRSIFENLLLEQLQHFEGSCILVRGLPGNPALPFNMANNNIRIKNHLASTELNEVIEKSGMIISRSGYTTIMDLVKLGKKAILVPTPGQSEQEYLAGYLMQQNMFYTMQQENFDLNKALLQAEKFPFDIPQFDMNLYKDVIRQFAKSFLNV